MLRLVTRVRRKWLAIATTFALLALGVVVVACDDNSTTTVLPTTGILVRAETLTTGKGCGTATTNIYKYAVIVYGYDGGGADTNARASYTTPIAGNLYDCFADGEFVALVDPAGKAGGDARYRLEVYAYNKAAYDASQAAIESALSVCSLTCQIGTQSAMIATQPTWTTVCTATQSTEVETAALCDAVSSGVGAVGGNTTGPSTITLDTTSFHLPDGRLARCGAGGTDAGADAGDAGADAGDAGDGGADGGEADGGVVTVPFATARIRYRIGATVGPTVDLPCPTAYVAQVSPEATAYDIDVGLVDGTGAVVGQVLCGVSTSPGQTTPITCP